MDAYGNPFPLLQATEILVQIAMGLLLASAAGIRAFLPLACVSLAAFFGWIPLHARVAWMGTLPAVLVFGAAVLFEVLGDKFPTIDHLLDAVGTVVRPAAGALVAFGVMADLPPAHALAVALIAGAPLAAFLHVSKAKTRLGLNLLSFGLAAPLLSVVEDLLVTAIIAIALFVPVAAVALALLVLLRIRPRGGGRSAAEE